MMNFLKIAFLVLGGSLFLFVPSFATENENEEVATEQNENERVCRRVHVTGSHIPKRYCFTRGEWADIRQETQEELAEHQRNQLVQEETTSAY